MHAILIKTNNDEADRKNQFQTTQVHATCDCLSSTVTITDFTLHFSCCFTKLLHSLFITLLNNFTM